jgi:hypothetical protein
VSSVIGRICALTIGLVFNSNEQRTEEKILQRGIFIIDRRYFDKATPIAAQIDSGAHLQKAISRYTFPVTEYPGGDIP